MNRLVCIMVCVNYSDILQKILLHNISIVDVMIIITTPTDIDTINLLRKYNIITLLSLSCYDNESKFNKSKMINIGLEYAYTNYSNDVYLILDADICLNKDIKMYINNINDDTIYGTDRYLVDDIQTDIFSKTFNINNYILESSEQWYIDKHINNNIVYGYFQLFKTKRFYNEIYKTAEHGDVEFSTEFKYKMNIDCNVTHIGQRKINWEGRK